MNYTEKQLPGEWIRDNAGWEMYVPPETTHFYLFCPGDCAPSALTAAAPK